jgi:Histidine kinase-, DNA gyrase B-, and HSP90-like ATPase/Type II secretion system (T2SS), protein E, N-terminal domain
VQGVPFVELGRRALDPDAVRAIPLDLLQRLGAIPYELSDGVLHVAVGELTPTLVAELQHAGGGAVTLALAAQGDIAMLLYEIARGGTLESEDLRLDSDSDSNAPAVRAVNEILRRAAVARASDVHLVPDKGFLHVRNAVKFTGDGGRVDVSVVGGEDEVVVRVSDTGRGIEAADQQHLFERFFRAPDSEGLPGAGLGLSIVKAIVDAHGGTVRVESRAGAGTTFEVRFRCGGPPATVAAVAA